MSDDVSIEYITVAKKKKILNDHESLSIADISRQWGTMRKGVSFDFLVVSVVVYLPRIAKYRFLRFSLGWVSILKT